MMKTDVELKPLELNKILGHQSKMFSVFYLLMKWIVLKKCFKKIYNKN